jgi:hypothetical protein
MRSKRSHEGYLLIDHRAGMGLTPADAIAGGGLPVGHGATFESATITCSHCQRIVVMNPDRSRSRGYCPKCDHYVCDECEAVRVATLECRLFESVIEDLQERLAKGKELN